MTRTQRLERRIRVLLLAFIVGLVISGLTAFPLEGELRWLTGVLGAGPGTGPEDVSGVLRWLVTVREALIATNARYPFLAYGTDWLAFAHLVIAVAFVGPLRDPVRNRWVVTFGLVACAAVIPLALVAGAVRGIPLHRRIVDCMFGIVGAALLWPVARAIRELAESRRPAPVSTATADHYVWGDGCDGWHLVRTEGLSVIEERMPVGTAEQRHRHRHARQLFYVLAGTLHLEVDGTVHAVTAGSGLEVPPGVAHEARNDGPDEARFLVVSQPPSHGDRELAPRER